MALSYQYKNIPPQERTVLGPGDYPFTISNWEHKTTRKGDEMIRMKLDFDGGGSSYCNLVFSEKARWKIDQFLRCILINNPPQVGMNISFDDDLLAGARGMARVIKTSYLGSDNEQKDCNEVAEFLERPCPSKTEKNPF